MRNVIVSNSIDTTISKNKSLKLKFIAALFIILTHIFPKVGTYKNLRYIPLFYIGKYPIEQHIGSFSGICVGIFVFLSGYGLYVSSKENINYKYIIRRIIKLYINYWIITLIFFSIGKFMGVYKFELKEFVLNLLALNTTYNHPAWFLRLYVMLMLIYPKIVKKIDSYNKFTIIKLSFVMNIVGMVITKLYYMCGTNIIIVDLLAITLGGQFLFTLGIVVAKYSIFNKLFEKLGNNKLVYYNLLVIITIAIIMTIEIPIIGQILKLILIPIFIFVIANIISEKIYINELYKHSTNIWLIHAFFYDYLFADIVYSVNYSILIFVLLVALCLISSYIIYSLCYLIFTIIKL